MNDDFIYRALPTVRKEFAEALYTKISTSGPAIARPGLYSLIRSSRRLQFAIILLGALLLIAWSQVRLWIRYVPIGDLWVVEFSLTQSATDVQTMEPIPTPGQIPTMIIDGEIIMLASAFENVSPAWIPEGFSAIKIPVDSYSYEESIGMWINVDQETIRLFVVPRVGGARPYAPRGMYKEVQVNGQPAILVFGRLAPNPPENPHAQRKWDETLGLRLTWNIDNSSYTDNSIYTLETLGSYVTEDDLIRMAESMKVVPPPYPWESPTP